MVIGKELSFCFPPAMSTSVAPGAEDLDVLEPFLVRPLVVQMVGFKRTPDTIGHAAQLTLAASPLHRQLAKFPPATSAAYLPAVALIEIRWAILRTHSSDDFRAFGTVTITVERIRTH